MSLTSTVEELMTPRLVGRVASESGLSEAKVRNGLGGAVASIFGGLAGKATDRGVMIRVVDLVATTPDVDLTTAPERVLDESTQTRTASNSLLGLATGDSQGLISRTSSMLGVGGRAAGGLVTAAASLAIAAFKRLGRSAGGLDATKLASTLMDERREIDARLPGGMTSGMVGGASGAVSGMIGTARDRIDTDTTIRDRRFDRHDAYAAREEVERAPSRAWWWLVALIPLALLGYWLYNRSRTETTSAPVVAPPADVDRTDEPRRETAPDQTYGPPPSMREPGSTPQPGATTQPGAAGPSSMTEPGATGDAGVVLAQAAPRESRAPSNSVPTPPPDEESRDLPQHPGATPTSPKAGPADTEPSAARTYPAGSVETRLVQHIRAPRGADEDTWFELDQVSFAKGKAQLQAASQKQLDNVASILEANPDVKIRVGGFADPGGSYASKQRLSKARADAIAQALIAQGIDPERIDTTGAQPARGQLKPTRHAAIQVTSRGDLEG